MVIDKFLKKLPIDKPSLSRAINNHDGRMRIDFAMKEKHFLVTSSKAFTSSAVFMTLVLLLVLINIIILEQF